MVLRKKESVASLHFRSLLVDRPHPNAQCESVSTVLSSSTSAEDYIAVVNEFVLLLISGQRVIVWNWVTGKCHAKLDSVMPGALEEAILLQRTAFMVFGQDDNTHKLELYTFSANEPTTDEPPPILRAVFFLPSLQDGVEMTLQCRCNPPPFQYAHLVHPDMSSIPIDPPCYFRRPFRIQETSRIVTLMLTLRSEYDTEESRDIAIVVPLQTFIATDLDPEAPQGDPRVVPAVEWMRSSQVLAGIPLSEQWVYGTRFATLSPDQYLCICDFNPATIAYLKYHQERKRSEDRAKGGEGVPSTGNEEIIEWKAGNTDVGLVLSGADITDEMFFKEPLQSGIPFLMSVSDEKFDIAPNETQGVMIDDERILIVRVCGSTSAHEWY